MNKPPAFQFYPADFLMGTAFMSNAQVGAYIRLLCHQWDKGGIPVPKSLSMTADLQEHERQEVFEKFQVKEGLLVNLRMEAEREKQYSFRQKQEENAQKRWVGNAKLIPTHMPSSSQPICQNDALLSSSSSSSLSSSSSSRKKTLSSRGSKKVRAHAIPEEWTLPEKGRQFAVRLGVDPGAIDDMAAKFVDVFRSNGMVKADWLATWRNFVRKEIKDEEERQKRLDRFNAKKPVGLEGVDY